MSEDDKVKMLADVEAFANTPKDVTQLYPHERMLMAAIGEVGHMAQMRDVELIAGLERVTAYLKYQLDLAKKGATQKT